MPRCTLERDPNAWRRLRIDQKQSLKLANQCPNNFEELHGSFATSTLVTDPPIPFAPHWMLLANATTLAADRGMLDELEEPLEIETVSYASVNRTLAHLQCSLCNYLVTRDKGELAQTPKRRKSS